jgi:hypothetical protein
MGQFLIILSFGEIGRRAFQTSAVGMAEPASWTRELKLIFIGCIVRAVRRRWLEYATA